jgi:hypothetical protein
LSRSLAARVSRSPWTLSPIQLGTKIRRKPSTLAPSRPYLMVPRPIGPRVPCSIVTRAPIRPWFMLPRDLQQIGIMVLGHLGTKPHGSKRPIETSPPCDHDRSPYRPPWTMIDRPSLSPDPSISHVPRRQVTKLPSGHRRPRHSMSPEAKGPRQPAFEALRISRRSCEQAIVGNSAPSSHRLACSLVLMGPSMTWYPHLIDGLGPR